MLMIYSIGVVKMIFLFPMSSLLSLGSGMVAVLCMAFLFRQGPARSGMKQTDPKIRLLNAHRNDVRMKRNGLNFKKGLRLSSNYYFPRLNPPCIVDSEEINAARQI